MHVSDDSPPRSANVIDLFSRQPYSHPFNHRFIRLAPELDGMEMLYSNETHPDRLFSIKILSMTLSERRGESSGTRISHSCRWFAAKPFGFLAVSGAITTIEG